MCVGLDGPEAVSDGRRARSRRWRRSRCRRGCPAGGNRLHRLRRRRLLLPRRPRPGGYPDDHAPRLRRRQTAAPGFELERDYDLSGAVADRRQDHLRAARLVGPALVRLTRRASSGSIDRASGAVDALRARRADRELVRGRRRRRRVRRHRQGAVPPRRRRERLPGDDLARGRTRTPGIAKPGQVGAGSGTTPTLMRPRPRRDHRQRRPDERRGLPPRHERHGPRAGLRAARVREGRERDRQLADRRRARDRGREQLRLHRPDRHAGRQDDHARPGARRPRRRRHRLPLGLALAGDRADRRAQALGRQRARLHVHQGRRATTRPGRLVPDRAGLPHRQDRSSSASAARASATTTTTRRSRSAPTAPPTSACSAGCRPARRDAARRPPRPAPPRAHRPPGGRPGPSSRCACAGAAAARSA